MELGVFIPQKPLSGLLPRGLPPWPSGLSPHWRAVGGLQRPQKALGQSPSAEWAWGMSSFVQRLMIRQSQGCGGQQNLQQPPTSTWRIPGGPWKQWCVRGCGGSGEEGGSATAWTPARADSVTRCNPWHSSTTSPDFNLILGAPPGWKQGLVLTFKTLVSS